MWGILPLFMLLALADMDPFTVSFYRFAVAFGCVLAVAWLRGELPAPRQFGQRRWLWLLLAGIALTANYIGYILSLERLNPESAQVVIQIAPLLLMLGGIYFFNESFSPVQGLGAVILLLGFGLFFDDKWQVLWSGLGQYTTGVLLMMFAAVAWVGYALWQKFLLNHFTARQLPLLIYGWGCLLLLPFSSLTQVFAMSWLSGLSLLFCGFNTLIAYGSFTKAMAVWQASKVSAVIALAPVFTIVNTGLAAVLFPDLFTSAGLTGVAYLGALLVVVGSVVTALGKAREPRP